MQHLPPVLHCQPSSECAEKNYAAGLKCAVPSTMPSTWSSPTPQGRQGDQGMHKTQGVILSSMGINGRNVLGERQVPCRQPLQVSHSCTCHSGIPTAPTSPSSTLPRPAPILASADLTAILSTASRGSSCISQNSAVSRGSRSWPHRTLHVTHSSASAQLHPSVRGHQGTSSKGCTHLPQGCTVSAHA